MYLGYFQSREGHHHSPIHVEDEEALYALLFTYKGVVPTIIVTDEADATVAKAAGGEIIFPQMSDDAKRYFGEKYPEHTFPDFVDSDSLEAHMRVTVEELALVDDGPERQEGLFNLLALAACHDLNLYEYGYNLAETRAVFSSRRRGAEIGGG